MGPENLGDIGHFKPSKSGSDNKIDHGDHAVQLCLVQRYMSVEVVLTLLLFYSLMDALDDLFDNLLI